MRGAARLALVGAAAVIVIAGCGAPASPAPGGPLRVVTTITVLAVLVANVGGDDVVVTSLVPGGVDVHTFSPSPRDVQAVAEAQVLVRNGLGLDDWLTDLMVQAQAGDTPSVDLARGSGFDLIGGDEPGTENPHLWLSVPYAIRYVEEIRDTLAGADLANAGDYAARAAAYVARLETLDAAIREQLAAIPEGERRIVTFHDALPYFAREYDLDVVGVAVEAPGQEPSAAEIAALIAAIKATGVKAIFSEAQFPPDLVERIAAETGAHVVADLYTDSLGEPPITSYEALMAWDVARIAEALR